MSDFDEATTAPDPAAEFPVLEPKRIMVFGVLHIVFGGLGILGSIVTVGSTLFQGALLKRLTSSSGAVLDDYTRISLELAEKSKTMAFVGAGLALILGVLVLIAGIALVKKRANGLRASNQYAWVSIAFKLLALVLFLLVTKPMIDGLVDPYLADADTMLKTQLNTLKWTQAIAGVITPFLGMIYPILALAMLNKPIVRDFFAVKGQ